jgi:hypothetical protein
MHLFSVLLVLVCLFMAWKESNKAATKLKAN